MSFSSSDGRFRTDNVMRTTRTCSALAAILIGCAVPLVNADAPPLPLFSGGWYDGYTMRRQLAGMDYPQISNADGATNVTLSTAWLNGVLLATGGAPAQVVAFWGTTDGGTNGVVGWGYHTNMGYQVAYTEVAHQITTLPNSTYFYRFFATNDLGETGWATESSMFETPGPPVVEHEAGAHPVGHVTATLHGHLQLGAPAEITFRWGQSTNVWSYTSSIGTRQAGPFNLRITDLSPGQPYYYAIAASNVYASIETDAVSFHTQSDDPVFTGGWYDGYDADFTESTLRPIGGSLFLLR